MNAGDGRRHLSSWSVTARRKYPPSTNRQRPDSLRSRPLSRRYAPPPLRSGPAGDTGRPLRLRWQLRPAGFPCRPVCTGPADASHLVDGGTAATVCVEARQIARRRWTGAGSCRSSPASGTAAVTRWEAAGQVRIVRMNAGVATSARSADRSGSAPIGAGATPALVQKIAPARTLFCDVLQRPFLRRRCKDCVRTGTTRTRTGYGSAPSCPTSPAIGRPAGWAGATSR